jgi:sugar lactone lactonase YvrE
MTTPRPAPRPLGRPRAAHALLALPLAAPLACAPADARDADAGALARPLGVVTGFHAPESVRYDPERDVYYVSNIYLYGSEKDGNGFIAELDAADPRRGRILAQGGRAGVTLHAPKGMALTGDTLWTADIDALRGFHRVTGQPLATIDFTAHRPTLLNDVAVGPDGTLRVTDTGIVMSRAGIIADTTGDRVFRVGPGGAISAIPAGPPDPKPNGITWDARGQRWLVVTFGRYLSRLYALDDRTGARTPLAEGMGQWDGVEALADGRILVTSWSDSSVHLLDGDRDTRIVRHLNQPADLGVDTRRHRILVPAAGANRVELWSLPARR